MTEEQIKQLIHTGERLTLECKAAGNGIPKSLWESYSAFANTDGGTILLGVEMNKWARLPQERFSICGVSNARQRLRDFWNAANNPSTVSANILTPHDAGIIRLDDKDVLWIRVPAVSYKERPVYRGTNPFIGTYKRNYEGDYRCTEDEVRTMIRDSRADADSAIVDGCTLEDLDPATVSACRQHFAAVQPKHVWTRLSDEDFLRKLQIWVVDPKTRRVL